MPKEIIFPKVGGGGLPPFKKHYFFDHLNPGTIFKKY